LQDALGQNGKVDFPMAHIENLNLLDKAKRHHRRARVKDPALPAYKEGYGRVVSNGSLAVELPLVNGDMIIYAVTPATEWRFVKKALAMRPGGKAPAATPGDVIKHALDTALDVIADIEKRAARATEPKPDIVN
jgi:hypothetical protein